MISYKSQRKLHSRVVSLLRTNVWPPPAWSGGVVWSAVTRLVLPPGRCGWSWLLVAAGPGSGSGPGRARPRPAGGAALPVKLHSPHIGPRPQYTALPAGTRQPVALIHQTLQKWWLYSSENITKIEDVYFLCSSHK